MNVGGLGRAGRFLALGFEFAGAVVGGMVVGSWVDGRLGTSPLFLVVLMVFALTGAVYRLLWVLRRMKEENGGRGGPGGG
jgi:F0F1-type ATP synthase assembly protein I